jgi:hypothetical protein
VNNNFPPTNQVPAKKPEVNEAREHQPKGSVVGKYSRSEGHPVYTCRE